MQEKRGQEADMLAATRVEFHEETATVRAEFDRQTRQPSEAVIEAVAAAKGTDETALPPLFESIDPDALDTLFVASSNRIRRNAESVTFDYVDYQITVKGHGTVIVDPAGEVEAAD